ncbi:50S rRNA methyltransferase [Candidatus Saccharibacteria bacterium]|nr:MAG: 50S rRNA methyltransferase [Candidatus Saccharibacteria bacterium]
MKLHIVTVGEPKLEYARLGWNEYLRRLSRLHHVRTTHVADKWARDANRILAAAGKAYRVALVIDGSQYSSESLASFLDKQALGGRELCFIIGGPDGLPPAVIEAADTTLGLSKLTFPHDLAMLILAETLYRSSSINAQLPYHRA